MSKHGTLLLLLGVFVLPVGIAKLVLDMDWYHGGVTNRGDLLEQPLTSDWLGERHRWQLIYLLPDHCDDYCQGALFNLRQVPQAVGADHSRLDSVLLVQGDGLAAQPAVIRAQATGVTARQVPDYIVAKLKAQAHGTRAIYIADPMGNVMMAYPLVKGQTAVLAQGKDVLRDLKRLLKLSKIG